MHYVQKCDATKTVACLNYLALLQSFLQKYMRWKGKPAASMSHPVIWHGIRHLFNDCASTRVHHSIYHWSFIIHVFCELTPPSAHGVTRPWWGESKYHIWRLATGYHVYGSRQCASVHYWWWQDKKPGDGYAMKVQRRIHIRLLLHTWYMIYMIHFFWTSEGVLLEIEILYEIFLLLVA